MGRTHHVAKGDRSAACERGRVRDAQEPEPSGCRLLESGLRSKDSRAVRRRAVGKVPIEATRWRPILPQARFGGGCDPFSRNLECSKGFCQVVEAERLIRQAGASPQSYPPFRRPAPYLSLRPNSRIAAASLDDSRPQTTDAVAVESVG